MPSDFLQRICEQKFTFRWSFKSFIAKWFFPFEWMPNNRVFFRVVKFTSLNPVRVLSKELYSQTFRKVRICDCDQQSLQFKRMNDMLDFFDCSAYIVNHSHPRHGRIYFQVMHFVFCALVDENAWILLSNDLEKSGFDWSAYIVNFLR